MHRSKSHRRIRIVCGKRNWKRYDFHGYPSSLCSQAVESWVSLSLNYVNHIGWSDNEITPPSFSFAVHDHPGTCSIREKHATPPPTSQTGSTSRPCEHQDILQQVVCRYKAVWRAPSGQNYCVEHVPCELHECERIGSGKVCSNDNCMLAASFAKPRSGREQGHGRSAADKSLNNMMYCRAHCPDDTYVNVISRKCCESMCVKTCSFGIPGLATAPMYCKEHIPKAVGNTQQYENVVSRRCAHPGGCKTIPVFGLKGTKKPEFCKTHAPSPDYINVVARRCIVPGCDTQARWGLPGNKTVSCSRHRTASMVTTPTKYYIEEDAIENGCNFCGGIIDCTHDHESQQRLCKACAAYQQSNLVHTFRRHRKEAAIRDVLLAKGIEFVHDCRVENGCSKRRPDFQICAPWGSIVLEVDEEQHIRRGYSCECEVTRMKQIYYDVGVQNLLFIRYNPDGYIPLNSRHQQRCISSKKRQTLLIDYIDHLVSHDSLDRCAGFRELASCYSGKYGCFVCYLFYDGHDNKASYPLIEEIAVV